MDSSRIVNTYLADGTKLRSVYKTNAATLMFPLGHQCEQEHIDYLERTVDYCGGVRYEHDGTYQNTIVYNTEGYYSTADSAFFAYQKDYQGNIAQVWNVKTGQLVQLNEYFPDGTPTHRTLGEEAQPYKYNGNEWVRFNGNDAYDFNARIYYPITLRFDTFDPLAENHHDESPYIFCGSNSVNRSDALGLDWYQNDENGHYKWFNGNDKQEGYTYIGEKGSVLGDFETLIDDILTRLDIGSLYSEGFSFSIVNNRKGGICDETTTQQLTMYNPYGQPYTVTTYGHGLTDEFITNTGAEFSIFLGDHPYTEYLKNATDIKEAQKLIYTGNTEIPGQITEYASRWGIWDLLTTWKAAAQFIGSYSYDGHIKGDKLLNVVYDSKSRYSALYHIVPKCLNRRRSESARMGNTYQFYIWTSRK